MNKIVHTLVVPIAALLLTCCSTPADKVDNAEQKLENARDDVKEANKDLDKATEEYMNEVASFRQETAEKIAINDKSISEIRGDIDHQRAEDRVESRKKLIQLEDRNRELKKRMDEYKADSKAKWQNFKDEFNHDMQGLGESLKDFTKKDK